MTDKEKIRISKIDMFKLMDISKQLVYINEKREELVCSLYGTGIDYSKDHVQTTPSNMMEEAQAQLYDIDKKIDELLYNRGVYLKKIYTLKKDLGVNILIDKYVHLKSFNMIAEDLKKSKSTVIDIHNQTLIEYFNTKCCINY